MQVLRNWGAQGKPKPPSLLPYMHTHHHYCDWTTCQSQHSQTQRIQRLNSRFILVRIRNTDHVLRVRWEEMISKISWLKCVNDQWCLKGKQVCNMVLQCPSEWDRRGTATVNSRVSYWPFPWQTPTARETTRYHIHSSLFNKTQFLVEMKNKRHNDFQLIFVFNMHKSWKHQWATLKRRIQSKIYKKI